jgi:glucokinase
VTTGGREYRSTGQFGGPRIGVDLGGTTVTAVITGDGDMILDQSMVSTNPERSVDTILTQIAELVLGLCEKSGVCIDEVNCAGIGVPGEVSASDACLRSSPILTDWKSVPVGDLLEARLGNPWSVDNDANVALLGEWKFGAGQGYDSILLLTIGTGIGGAVLVNNELVHGLEGSAGEIGHVCVDPGGSKCWCGNRGCLGLVASTTALLDEYRRREKIPLQVELNGEDLRTAYLAGSTSAIVSVRQLAEYLAIGIRSAVCIVAPQAVILAGGIVSGLGVEISGMLREQLADVRYPAAVSRVAVRPAANPGISGALGASILSGLRER